VSPTNGLSPIGTHALVTGFHRDHPSSPGQRLVWLEQMQMWGLPATEQRELQSQQTTSTVQLPTILFFDQQLVPPQSLPPT